MLRLIAAATVLVFLVAPSHAQTYLSYVSGKQYIFPIYREALEKSPSWKDDADHPPFPARKAIQRANAMKDQLVKDSGDMKWQLEEAALIPAQIPGKWYWLIRYALRPQKGGATGVPESLGLVVLMDGTAIKPEVRDYK